mmetsp:Transcript_193/g.400  ORF Transcript_193/g.400 Transcript_193/m.400 type:complete len:263 (+) Transcript_193:1696-2484(+)
MPCLPDIHAECGLGDGRLIGGARGSSGGGECGNGDSGGSVGGKAGGAGGSGGAGGRVCWRCVGSEAHSADGAVHPKNDGESFDSHFCTPDAKRAQSQSRLKWMGGDESGENGGATSVNVSVILTGPPTAGCAAAYPAHSVTVPVAADRSSVAVELPVHMATQLTGFNSVPATGCVWQPSAVVSTAPPVARSWKRVCSDAIVPDSSINCTYSKEERSYTAPLSSGICVSPLPMPLPASLPSPLPLPLSPEFAARVEGLYTSSE